MSAPDAGVQPWLGLLPYSEDEQKLFFGREQDTLDLLRLVRREVVTVLFGRSGTGKSSLLKAGLFPKLRHEQFLPVWIRLDHSGKASYGHQVRTEIENAIASRKMEVEVLNAALTDESNDMWEYLHRMVFWDSKNQPVTPVLVFDQFEELFTLGHNRPEIAAFLEELAAVAENLIPKRIRERVVAGAAKLPAPYNERHYKVMISLREDFVSRLDGLSKDMPSVMHNRHALSHMTGEQALDVVMKPGGKLVDKAVARRIVRFVAAANEVEAVISSADTEAFNLELRNLHIEPALLSLVCRELNLQRIKEERTEITLEQVQRSSDQILDDFYQRSLEGLDVRDRAFVEDRLVTASGFRTTVPVEEAILAGLTDDEIECLVDRRLLRREDRLGTPHIELTHDVLTKVVIRSRHLRQQRDELKSRKQKDDQEELERRTRKEAQDIEKKRLRRMRYAVRIIGAGCAVLITLSWMTLSLFRSRSELQNAQKKTVAAHNLSEARAQALSAISVGDQDPELALLLSIESAAAAFPDARKPRKKVPREVEMAQRTATRESLIRKRYDGHSSDVYSIDFDREGRRLVTSAAADDSTARIWDVESGQEIARLDHGALPGGETTVSCARFSHDARRIVTTTYRKEGDVYIWDADALRKMEGGVSQVVVKPLLTFTGHHAKVTTAAFSPDGKMVASGGYDKRIRLWDPTTGKELLTTPLGSGRDHHTARIRSVSFNFDGGRLLSTSDDGNAMLWELHEALKLENQPDSAPVEPLWIFKASATETLHDGDLNPLGTLVATVGNDKTLRVWDVVTGRQLAAQSHPDGVMGVSFIDNTRLVTVCNDAAIRFWVLGDAADEVVGSFHPQAKDVKILRLLATQRGHRGWIRDVAVSPDQRFIATCGNDHSARLWKLPPGGEVAVLGEPEFESWAADIHYSPAAAGRPNRLLAFAGTSQGEVRGVDAFKERPLEDWWKQSEGEIKHTKEVRCISVSPDGSSLVTSSSDQTVIVWDAITGRPKFKITGHQGPGGGTVYHARFSADGKHIVTASNEGSARVWNALTGAPELMLVPDRQQIAPDGFKDFPALLGKLKDPAQPISAFLLGRFTAAELAKLEDSGTVITVLNRIIRDDSLKDEPAFGAIVRRPMTLELAKRKLGDNDRRILNRLILEDTFPAALASTRVYDARFSRDGSKIVTADFSARTATIWDAHDGTKLRVFPGGSDRTTEHSDDVTSAAFSPDGRQVVTASTDGYCRIWDAATGALVKAIPHDIAVRSAEFNSEGNLLLTAAADGVARLWTLPGCQLRTELKGHTETLPDARFSNDGDYIVTASRDGTARIYHTKPWWVYSLATQRVTRKLTREEREQYGVTRELTAEETAYYQKTGDTGVK